MAKWADLERALQQQISGERLQHTYRVVEAARSLSLRFGASVEQAEVAALMHDYAKAMPGPQLLAEARRLGLLLDPAEEAGPYLLHGPVAAALLAERGLVTDTAVLDAIRWHTTGRAGMSLLEKVIWLADYIEPGRIFPGVDEIRQEAEHDLDKALLLALGNTITFVVSKGWPIHLYTVHAWNWLLNATQHGDPR